MRSFKIVVPLLMFAMLSACVVSKPFEQTGSQLPDQPRESGVQAQAAITPESSAPAEQLPTPATPRQRTSGAATKALVTQAQAQMNAGNDALAAATIERALRIESNNPSLWIELAKIRQNEGNATQAENLARKALAMAGNDSKAQALAWRVIAETYRARGRNPEARDADARANALE